MIAALAAALQLAIGTQGQPAAVPQAPSSVSVSSSAGWSTAGPLIVKDASHSLSVPLVQTPTGPLLRAEQLKPIVAVTVSHLMADKWMIIIGNMAIEVEPGVRFAKMGDDTYQLSAVPEVRKGALYVPLQLVVEIIPKLAGNLVWDPEHFELRAFSSVGRYAAREAAEARAAPPRSSQPAATDTRPPAQPAKGAVVAGSPAPTGPLRTRHLVVVDAGHGGPDAGMHGPIGPGPAVTEKAVTLEVAKRVGAALSKRGIDVKYTRTTDTLIALSDRGRIANDAHADLFVSIHVNAANPTWKDPGAARGFETYFLAEAKTEDARRVEQMENEVVKFETKSSAHAGDPLSFILNDMAQNEHLRESNELAELIQRRLGRVHPGANRGVKQAGFRVLVTAFMPAVLVEIGFGTNPADAEYMNDSAKMDELSVAISDAVLEYLKRYERRVTASATATLPRGGAAER
jgi:N-acetylmuramoyl-L-alanine amidase